MDSYNMRLKGKKALVTGSGSGLGRETALEFARQGADIVLHFHSSGSVGAESAAREIESMGRRAYIFKADLRDADEAVSLAERSIKALGTLDILVNNAGLTNTMKFIEVGKDEYNDLFNLNMRGMFFCTQAAVKHMMEKGGGVILNMSSMHGLASLPGYSVYSPTKGAIIAFTKQLAIELGKYNIRVNCVAPGAIIVPSDYAKYPDLNIDEIGKGIPNGKVGQPIDVAKLMSFLASDDASYITGSVSTIDGGILAKAAFFTPEAVE